MKSIQTILVMCLLKGVLQATPVTADGPTSISGYVTDDSTEDPIDDVELAFENLRTEETVYAQTNQYGYYYLALNSFTQGMM